MRSISQVLNIELAVVIVEHGLGSKVLRIAKAAGIKGGTVLMGVGTAHNNWMDYFGLSDVRKEIVMMLADKKSLNYAIKQLDKAMNFEKPNHGIAFTSSICLALGSSNLVCGIDEEDEGVDDIMYQSIFTIVDRGKAEYVMEAATKAGAKGGTIIHARGSGIHETMKVFSMSIEPEKEIVLILSPVNETQTIIDAIRTELDIDTPGQGIIFVQDVNRTYGLYKGETKREE